LSFLKACMFLQHLYCMHILYVVEGVQVWKGAEKEGGEEEQRREGERRDGKREG